MSVTTQAKVRRRENYSWMKRSAREEEGSIKWKARVFKLNHNQTLNSHPSLTLYLRVHSALNDFECCTTFAVGFKRFKHIHEHWIERGEHKKINENMISLWIALFLDVSGHHHQQHHIHRMCSSSILFPVKSSIEKRWEKIAHKFCTIH